MDRLRADLMLLVAAFFWGTSFLGQKQAGASLGPLLIVGLRFLSAGLMLLPLVLIEARRARTPLTRRDWRLAGALGLCSLGGTLCEQWGLESTSITNAGFLTALYVVMVPFAVWSLRRIPPRLLVLSACLVCLTGAWLLTERGAAHRWTQGDVLVVLADVFWAYTIALLDLFLAKDGRPFFVAVAIDAVTSIPALAGAAFLDDMLTPAAALGCGLILLSVAMVEAGPPLLRKLKFTAA